MVAFFSVLFNQVKLIVFLVILFYILSVIVKKLVNPKREPNKKVDRVE